MSFEATSRSATKKKFAEKFAKELEAHIAYGDKLAKSLSNPNIANAQTTPIEDQDIQHALNAYAYSAVKPSKDEDHPSFTARIRDYIQQHQSQKVDGFEVEPQEEYRDNYSDYNTPDRKETLGRNVQYNTNQHHDDSIQTLDEINAKNYSTLQEKYDQQNRSNASSRQAYSSNEGNRLPLNLPKRIQQNPAGDNRRDTSPVLNSSENVSGAEVKRSESAQLEPSSYLFPNMEKNASFKKKIISDSMQRLKNSVYNSGAPTRENSIKSGLFHEPEQNQGQGENSKKLEHEIALRQMLANTSLTYENGDAKSSDDSFHAHHDRSHSMSIKKMDSILDKVQAGRDQPLSERGIIPRGNGRLEEEGSIIHLRELFRNSANEANASKLSLKKNSHPNTGRSPRDSYTASQLFRPSESESYVMNVSRLGELDDPAEIQERIEELRRYSMELGVGWNPEQNAPEPVKEVAYPRRHQSDIGESSSANEAENTRYMSSNTMEGMKSLRTPDFQSYASQMKDNHFFALHNQQENARNGAGAQKRNNSTEGNKKSIIKKFSQELERGLANRLPVPQPRPIDPQESSEYPESQEMMGFLSFSKEHGRTDASETLHSPDKYGYDASVSYSRELQDRSHFRRAMQEEEKERAQISMAMEKQLAEAVSKVNIKTFLALRSILKPHRAIVLCCEGVVKLLSGFDDIPASLEEQESVDWSQIKALFNSPVKIVNLVSSFKNLANNGKITAQKIEAVELVLSRIQVHLDTPQHEAFTQLHGFLTAAVQYYESCFQDTYYNIRKETFEEPERVAPVPMQYTAPPQRPKIPTATTAYKPVNTGARKSPIQSRYGQGKYSPQKVETNKTQVQQRQSKSVGRARPPSDKKDRENQGNTSNITRNSQNIRKEETGRSTSQTKSASKTPTKKNVSAKIDNKRVVLGQKPLEDNYMKGKNDIYEEEMSGDGVRFLVDVEQSEAGELKDTIEAKEKEAREYRNKVKKMLFEHDRFVKKFLKQQEDLEDEINREFATEDWRKTNQMKQEQTEFERDWRHQRNMDYINEKKEVKENQDRENKENVNEELLEGLQDHYYHQFTVQTKKENKKKELREKYKSLLANKISKKQQETMESISQKEELAQRRRDHFKSRKIDIENEKNKWQSDYLMLSKLIGDAK